MTLSLDFSAVSPRRRPQPKNALLASAAARHDARSLPPADHSQLLRSTIGLAALLSDTPEKWAATLDLLRQHGVDPAGYEDFEKGRPAAIAASGVTAHEYGDEELETALTRQNSERLRARRETGRNR